jgi:hypothetical protein
MVKPSREPDADYFSPPFFALPLEQRSGNDVTPLSSLAFVGSDALRFCRGCLLAVRDSPRSTGCASQSTSRRAVICPAKQELTQALSPRLAIL